jgi:CxxC-x17-CxxC domain-containing protein
MKEKEEVKEEKVVDDTAQLFMRLQEMDAKLDTLLRNREVQMQFPPPQPVQQRPPPQKESWPATCSDCGKSCFIPFKPYPGSPIKCPDCYKRARGY